MVRSSTIKIYPIEDKRYFHSAAESKIENLLSEMDTTQRKLSIFGENTHNYFNKFVYKIIDTDVNEHVEEVPENNLPYGFEKAFKGIAMGVLAKYNIDNKNRNIYIDGFYIQGKENEYLQAVKQFIENIFTEHKSRKIYVSVLDDNKELKSIYFELDFVEKAVLQSHILTEKSEYNMSILCLEIE